jgi:DNA polymerase/3'-5' exonuclease PolX
MTNDRIAQALRSEAARREQTPLGRAEPHRIAAFRKAADAVAVHGEPLDLLYVRGNLESVPGVGPKIAAWIGRLIDPAAE